MIATYMVVFYTDPQRSLTMIDHKAIAAHVLRHLAAAQSKGRLVRLDELAMTIGVRREDVRDVVAQLHTEGHVDAARLRLTMTGLAIAACMRECKLAAPRKERRYGYVARVA